MATNTQAGIGFSKAEDINIATKEAYEKAINNISKPSLLIAFSSIKYNQEDVVKTIGKVSGNTALIGCSDAGEISTAGPDEGGLAIMAIESEKIKFTLGSGGALEGKPREAGKRLAQDIKAKSKDELKCIVILTDVLKGNGADVVRGVQDEMGKDFLIMGGAAGDDFLFKETFVYLNDEAMSSSVVGVGLSGDFSLGVGVRHGWVPIGLPMKVTKSNGAVIEEINGKPAVSVYEERFGKSAEDMRKEPLATIAITYPLGLSVDGSDELLIRDPISVDEKGAITCAAEIPEGSEVRIMIGSQDEAIVAAKNAAETALSHLNGKKPVFALMFNCIARKKLFGRKANEEIEAIKKILGEDLPLIGFYTYGEQAPLGGDLNTCFSCFHNETAVILLIGE